MVARSYGFTDVRCGGTNCQRVGSDADVDCSDRVASTEYEVAKSAGRGLARGGYYLDQCSSNGVAVPWICAFQRDGGLGLGQSGGTHRRSLFFVFLIQVIGKRVVPTEGRHP